MTTPKISPIAQSGFANASYYDAHRPSYPTESVNALLEALHINDLKGARVVDLAAGTGRFTEILKARPEGYEIVAVEPHGEMLDVLKGKDGLKGVRTVVGKAEEMTGVEGRWADAVVVAQVCFISGNGLI
jgi:ubiquinone/menaquinone biosynthesis C-methylase UbiE